MTTFLLQASVDYSSAMFYLFIFVLGIVLMIIIVRIVFRIDTQVNNQRAMIWLLIRLLKQQGVDQEELNKLIKTFKIK